MEIWYAAQKRRGTLPAKYEGWSLREIERDLGMGTPARDGRVYRSELRDIEIETRQEGDDTVTEYHTPVGTVSTRQRRSQVLERGGISHRLEIEHLIKGPADYAAVEYLVLHTELVPTYDEYLAYEREIGDDGVPMVSIGVDPMYQILQEYIGYDNAFFHLHDYPELVGHLVGVLNEQAQVMQRIVLDSPAKLFLHGQHFDSMMTPPYLFQEYMVPYYRPFAERLGARGKVLACHADADTSLLLDLIKEAGFHMAECFVTAPMVSVTLSQAREAFGTKVIIWGGIPSVILCDPIDDRAFEAYMLDLFRTIAPGDAFVLGVADNVMAEAKLGRIERIGEIVAKYGSYPVRVP
jgi:uroporphyrinogen-III decarboxylase